PGNVGHAMLAVGVERDNGVCALLQREIDPGLERGTLPKIDGMADDRGRDPARQLARLIGRSVVDNDDVIAALAESRYHLDDRACFVIGRTNDPDRSGLMALHDWND